MESTRHEITAAATAVLANSNVRELRDVRVDNRENKIRLSGRVRSFYHKQLAQEAVKGVAGGLRVENHVDVCGPLVDSHS